MDDSDGSRSFVVGTSHRIRIHNWCRTFRLHAVFRVFSCKAGLPQLRFHDTRHAHASLMLRNGFHPKIVSERLGHSTISVTIDLYSHVIPGLQEAAALRYAEELFIFRLNEPSLHALHPYVGFSG